MFSHAHFDHYDGIYHLPDRRQVRGLDARPRRPPVTEPFRLRAPFLDARPVKIDRQPKDGETPTWGEYRFSFHFFPGQSEFTMGVETIIDGKKCFFTADNFFHQDMFSGSGGWMGLNRSFPLLYADSARQGAEGRPRLGAGRAWRPLRVQRRGFSPPRRLGQESAQGRRRSVSERQSPHDWNPHRIHVEPLVHKAKPGDTIEATLVVDPQPSGGPAAEELNVVLEGRGLLADQSWQVRPVFGGPVRRGWKMAIGDSIPVGRNVFVLRVTGRNGLDASDGFLVIDVEK